MSIFDHSKQFLERHYLEVERLRMAVWEELDRVQDELVRWGELDPDERAVLAQATFNNGILKIVVNDYPPKRSHLLKNPQLRVNWSTPVAEAIRTLNAGQEEKVRFNRIFCLIVPYLPQMSNWDTDNRAFSMIINGLRYGGVLPSDAWEYVTYMVMGQVDKKHPRTEIYVMEQNQLVANFLTTVMQKKIAISKEEKLSEYVPKNATYPQPAIPPNKNTADWW